MSEVAAFLARDIHRRGGLLENVETVYVVNVDDLLGPGMNDFRRRWKRTFMIGKHPIEILFSARAVPEFWSVKSLQGTPSISSSNIKKRAKADGCRPSFTRHHSQMMCHFPIGNHLTP
jgi:hypothetical protein